ncbi:uncharacterized protein BX663DRAFT_511015 [Cokeromyces recurvatus]|uniref:uncharacterized protein n=1 Tax=Cokeromyces recurvatus TaxID=90255 RepID=UPI00221F9DF1|nr:uncharacterized protein BX663DRAFT_511015 [Cokeromyces recurvatus]KAI7902425.1 hypothetical protein BX663DRAFT_511015 [Cokeromyces recurvatus]
MIEEAQAAADAYIDPVPEATKIIEAMTVTPKSIASMIAEAQAAADAYEDPTEEDAGTVETGSRAGHKTKTGPASSSKSSVPFMKKTAGPRIRKAASSARSRTFMERYRLFKGRPLEIMPALQELPEPVVLPLAPPPSPATSSLPVKTIRRKRKLHNQKVVLPPPSGPQQNLVFEEAGGLSYANYLDPQGSGSTSSSSIVLGIKKRKVSPSSVLSVSPLAPARLVSPLRPTSSSPPPSRAPSPSPSVSGSQVMDSLQDEAEEYFSADDGSSSPYYTASEGSPEPEGEPKMGFWSSLVEYFVGREE